VYPHEDPEGAKDQRYRPDDVEGHGYVDPEPADRDG
jgi:hypothetical protein